MPQATSTSTRSPLLHSAAAASKLLAKAFPEFVGSYLFLTFARALRVGIDCLNQIAIKIEQQQLFSLGWRIRLGDVLLGSVRTVGAIRVYAAWFRKMARCPVPNCLRPSEPKESENLSWYLLPFDRNFSQPASAITPARPGQGRAANDNARVVFGNFR